MGATRSTAGEVTRAYLRDQVSSLRSHDVGFRRGTADAVHQLRVSTRRIRGALTTFRRILDRDATRELSAELRWLAACLAPARDTEVLHQQLAVQLAALPSELVIGPVEAYLVRYLGQQEADASAAALAALDSPRYAALLRSLDRLVAEPPFTAEARRPARTELRKPIRRADRELRTAADRLAGLTECPDLDAALHEVRKEAKRAGYAADVAIPVSGKRLRHWRRRVKAIQRTLGEHHDCVLAQATLREIGARAHRDGADTFTYELLRAHNTMIADAHRRTFTKQWRAPHTGQIPHWLHAR
ncbi:MAG: CHAD domain-containing protein [Sciscionella sp.]